MFDSFSRGLKKGSDSFPLTGSAASPNFLFVSDTVLSFFEAYSPHLGIFHLPVLPPFPYGIEVFLAFIITTSLNQAARKF